MTFNHRRWCSMYISFFVCVLVCTVYVCLFLYALFTMFFRCMLDLDVCKFIPCYTSIFYLFVYLSIFLSIHIIHLHDDVFIDRMNRSWSGPSDSGPILWGHKNRKMYTAIAPSNVTHFGTIFVPLIDLTWCLYELVCVAAQQVRVLTSLCIIHCTHFKQVHHSQLQEWLRDFSSRLHHCGFAGLSPQFPAAVLCNTNGKDHPNLPAKCRFLKDPGWCIDITHKVAKKYRWTRTPLSW